MAQSIYLYDMPDEQLGQTFMIYEVNSNNIHTVDNLHKIGKPHRHKYYEIFVFVEGNGEHEIDFHIEPITSNSIHFLSPGQVHYITRGVKYHGFEIIFSRDFYLLDLQDKEKLLDLPYFNNSIKPILNLNTTEFKELMIPIIEICKEYTLNRDVSNDIIRSYLHVLLMKCKYYFIQKHRKTLIDEDSDQFFLSRYRNLVERYFLTRHAVQEYADMMTISSSVLNSRITKVSGQNAREIIINRIVLEAKRLLLFSDMSNKEIAFRLNYEDPSYFSRIFKKRTGHSPTEFREEKATKR
jgi:AraC-like DNA-binding protein